MNALRELLSVITAWLTGQGHLIGLLRAWASLYLTDHAADAIRYRLVEQ